mmetsp:Transcript_17581/g.27184  ORF Transcript_17581/g.27184 Transcript_17581/m.27184 type:complete len:87 (+) Transcript_17581:836-1096(+)
MDCNMPFVDGYQATYNIRQYLHRLDLIQPIILAVTGHSEKTYIQKAFLSGMNQVLPKPVQFQVLRKILLKCGFDCAQGMTINSFLY